MVICLERGADLHMAQMMPLPLTVSCFSKIDIRFTFLVLVHPGGPGQRAVNWVCVCVPVLYCFRDAASYWSNVTDVAYSIPSDNEGDPISLTKIFGMSP